MVYSARGVPRASMQRPAFDAHVRTCLENFTCLHPDDCQWTQACFPTSLGGLGLRSLSKHSTAAFLASRTSCYKLCQELDPAHVLFSPSDSGRAPEASARDLYNQGVDDDQKLPEQLSRAIESRSFAECGSSSVSTAHRAHLKLITAEGSGLWLSAVPAKHAKLNNDPELFVGMLRRWLHIPFAYRKGLRLPLL